MKSWQYSMTGLCLQRFCLTMRAAEQDLEAVFQRSLTFMIINSLLFFLRKVSVYIMILDPKFGITYPLLFKESVFISRTSSARAYLWRAIRYTVSGSVIVSIAVFVKKQWRAGRLRSVFVFMLSAVLTNVFLILVFKKNILLQGWVVRAVMLWCIIYSLKLPGWWRGSFLKRFINKCLQNT